MVWIRRTIAASSLSALVLALLSDGWTQRYSLLSGFGLFLLFVLVTLSMRWEFNADPYRVDVTKRRRGRCTLCGHRLLTFDVVRACGACDRMPSIIGTTPRIS